MIIKNLIGRPQFALAPDEQVPGSEGVPVQEEVPVEPETPPLPDFNDAFVQAEISRRAQELATQQVETYRQDLARQATQYQQPQFTVPQKTQEQIRAERIAKVVGQGDWEGSVGAIMDLVESERNSAVNEAVEKLRGEFSPLIRHSATQSATSAVLRSVKDVPVESRQYIEQIVDEMGFNPKDLEVPKNAELVADAAWARAQRAGKITPQAPAQTGTLFNQPRTAVQSAAPISNPVTKTWRDAATPAEQVEIDRMFANYTPKGMKPEDMFTEKHIQDALRGIRIAEQFEGVF